MSYLYGTFLLYVTSDVLSICNISVVCHIRCPIYMEHFCCMSHQMSYLYGTFLLYVISDVLSIWNISELSIQTLQLIQPNTKLIYLLSYKTPSYICFTCSFLMVFNNKILLTVLTGILVHTYLAQFCVNHWIF